MLTVLRLRNPRLKEMTEMLTGRFWMELLFWMGWIFFLLLKKKKFCLFQTFNIEHLLYKH